MPKKDLSVKVKKSSKHGVVKDVRVKVNAKDAYALVANGKDIGKKISKLNTKGMRSIVGDEANRIQVLLEDNDNDAAISLLYKKLLQSLVDLVPYAEHAIRKSKGARGVYQINSLISSIRELMVDIQAAQDRGMLGSVLVEDVIRPAFLDIAVFLAQEYAKLAIDTERFMTPQNFEKWKDILRSSRDRIGDKATEEYKGVQEKTINYLQR